MSDTPRTQYTKEERKNSILGWDSPFLKQGGLLMLLSDFIYELTDGQQEGDREAGRRFRRAFEDGVLGLERALTTAQRERDEARAELNTEKTDRTLDRLGNADGSLLRDLRWEIDRLKTDLSERTRERDALRGRVAELDTVLRYFTGCTFTVDKSIDERGYAWCEAYLDEVLPKARALLAPAEKGVKR